MRQRSCRAHEQSSLLCAGRVRIVLREAGWRWSPNFNDLWDMALPTVNSLEAVASVATAVGVGFAAYQLWLTHRLAVTAFEDALAKEYRELAATLPTKALLDQVLTTEELSEALDEFYHYFDLSNGEIFLRQIGRVSKKTWGFWSDGIRSHFRRPAFQQAWQFISSRTPKDFAELRRALREDFQEDPRSWNRSK